MALAAMRAVPGCLAIPKSSPNRRNVRRQRFHVTLQGADGTGDLIQLPVDCPCLKTGLWLMNARHTAITDFFVEASALRDFIDSMTDFPDASFHILDTRIENHPIRHLLER